MRYVHPTILIVDDDAELREALSEVLRDEGYAVDTAANGRAALNKLQGGFQPCIILMDLMMPEMSGHEFRREQLADPNFADIPFIAYSGISDLATHAEQLRVNAYIQKPASVAFILAAVRQHCLK